MVGWWWTAAGAGGSWIEGQQERRGEGRVDGVRGDRFGLWPTGYTHCNGPTFGKICKWQTACTWKNATRQPFMIVWNILLNQDMGSFRWRASHLILRCVMYELLTLTEKICGLCVLMRVFLFLSTFYNPLHYLHILVFLRHMLKIKGQNELNA